MKYRFLFVAAFSVLTFSCSINEMVDPEEGIESPLADEVFYATIDDQPFDVETKVYVDGLSVLWNADDRITVFNKKTGGVEYRFNGEEGSNSGVFKKVLFDAQPSGNDLDLIYAVYPHQVSTVISDGGSISYTLPDVQTYRPNSFGQGANVMVSRTEDRQLTFKNAGGFLSFRLSGADISVSSVILEGKNGEKLAGDCTINVSSDGIPSITMASSNVSEQVRLHCKDVIVLSSSEYTEFWFALPPVTFSNGLTLNVTTPNGKVYTKSTSKTIKVERCTVTRMAPVNLSSFSSSTTNNLTIKEISSNAGGYGVSVKKSDNTVYYNKAVSKNDTLTITLPTVTDFSQLELNYTLNRTSDVLRADGKVVQNGTPIDARNPVTLTVCRGYAERRFTLVARNTGLPVVRINTTGFTLQDVDSDIKDTDIQDPSGDHRIWRPEADSGQTATITIEYPDGTVDCDNLPLQIKGRGNASWTYKKKPYALKLDSKSKVLGMKKSKRWILLANWKDRTLLRNDAAFWLSKKTDLPYTVSGQYVELEFNGVHRGNYYLCEQIKIDENRVAIEEWVPEDDATGVTGGFIMEIDNNFDEQFKFESDEFGLKYMFKDPDKNLSQAAVTYMTDYINNLETKIKDASNSDYKDYFDIESAIWFMFVNELTGNGDFFNTDGDPGSKWYGPHSTNFYKNKDIVKKDGSVKKDKLHMGPVWDFDYLTFISTRTKNGRTENRSKMWVGADQSGYYYYYMCKDSVFYSKMLQLWSSYTSRLSGFANYIDGKADEIRLSEGFNTTMWGYNGTDQNQNGDNSKTFQQAVDLMKTAFSEKLTWMDNNLSTLNQ